MAIAISNTPSIHYPQGLDTTTAAENFQQTVQAMAPLEISSARQNFD